MQKPSTSPARTSSAFSAFTALQSAAGAAAGLVYANLEDHGLTVSQFAVLEALYHRGRLCQKDLAGEICKSRGNLTMVADNLEKRGLVVRRRRKEDRRFLEVALTAKGQQRIAVIAPALAARTTAVMDLLSSDEQQQLTSLCRKLQQLAESCETDAAAYAVTRPTKVYDD